MSALGDLDQRVADCRACPRLVRWREEVARTKRAAFADWTYWGRAVPGFGPSDARLLILGLAPAAHGANRTGRMFTGDRSGDVLYRALYDVGLASRPTAVSADDGLTLRGVRITSPVHCAPPENKPTPAERDSCRPWLVEELRLLRPTVRAVVVLGAFGWQAALPAFAAAGWEVPRPRPAFGHGTRVALDGPGGPGGPDGLGGLDLFGCYHVSQRNTFTGKLTPEMLRSVLREAADAAGLPTVDEGRGGGVVG
ncbi:MULTISPECIES: uracil-DNA glycosylase [Streptomyces]|uniref:Type-5 uracil-DNA glycosylase n=1 Tax=Streptomyces doudnae TaxID=3075536 RepID=A0ABD5ELZ9_9ACTN|nr:MULTISPECIES: uracil-DNA glycosylase [unclassified Streptomyces]MDT0435409.1 uracil-DNA glycosylase [Streptomyces sp. DSM 41981]MYQ64724.1 uracil-DNA glycosylase [Streptomyces sp. SID4950]SCD85043.1 uracil-DNA glycosylase, family 4 [Streptomyces sp. SolWspMP-5a-2]